MKTVAVVVACLLATTAFTNAQLVFGGPGFGPSPFFGPRFGPPPFFGPPGFGGGPFAPQFGPEFGQGRGLGYIGSLGLLALGGPIGLLGAAGFSGLLADDITRF